MCAWWLISLLAHKGFSREDRECYVVLASVTAKYFVSHFYSCRSTCTWWLISLLAHKGSSREDRECCAVLASATLKKLVFHFYRLPFDVYMVLTLSNEQWTLRSEGPAL